MSSLRNEILKKQRIVIKIGSSSLQHKETGDLDYTKMEVLVRELCNIRNQGKDVILVTSGAIAVGKKAVGAFRVKEEEGHLGFKQACAAIGQAKLMMIYQKMFAEYNQTAAQVLVTRDTIINDLSRYNAKNTFSELLSLGVIPIVNENDTVSTYEIEIGDNDTLSAIVAALTGADLLILLSDIDGLYTDDPRTNPQAAFIEEVEVLTEEYLDMAKKTTGSNVGTGGMNTKMIAARIATNIGADMIIANSEDIRIIHRIMDGRKYGTLFKANKDDDFRMVSYIQSLHETEN
ncbi:MAG: glutamate 5-kinase [Lachnospiraceae bacterium]|nr:glutamate 5-kinase [Lachnospiraceae bacterium]